MFAEHTGKLLLMVHVSRGRSGGYGKFGNRLAGFMVSGFGVSRFRVFGLRVQGLGFLGLGFLDLGFIDFETQGLWV